MSEQELHDFISQILVRTAQEPVRTGLVLGELIRILEEQNTRKPLVDMVRTIQGSLPEAYELKQEFSQADVDVIRRRADERKRREEEAANQGRC